MLVRRSSALTFSQWCKSAGIQHCNLVVSSAVARLTKSLRSCWSSRWGRLLMVIQVQFGPPMILLWFCSGMCPMAGSLLRRMNQWQTSGRCHKCCVRARWAPWRVLSGILCLGAINEPTEALAHSYEFAGRLGFWQKWTATPGSHNMGYVMRTSWPRLRNRRWANQIRYQNARQVSYDDPT